MKFNYSPDDFYHICSIETRFRDLDPLNHVNNAVFNTYFEEARIRFIQTVPELRKSMGSGFSFVLAQIDLKYVKPVLYSENIRVTTSLKKIGNSSITGIQAIFNEEDQIKAIAETTGVWYDTQNKRPARLPDISNPDQYLFGK